MARIERRITFYADAGWARVEDPRIPGWAWVGLYREGDGRIRVGTVVVATGPRIGKPGGEAAPVTGEVLRALGLGEIEKEANRRSAQLGDLGEGFTWPKPESVDPIGYVRQVLGSTPQDPGVSVTVGPKARARKQYRLTYPPPGGKIPDDYLAKVVKAYHAAIEHDEHPAPTIAADVGVSVNTARSWIKKARQRGLMPPGRPGYTG